MLCLTLASGLTRRPLPGERALGKQEGWTGVLDRLQHGYNYEISVRLVCRFAGLPFAGLPVCRSAGLPVRFAEPQATCALSGPACGKASYIAPEARLF